MVSFNLLEPFVLVKSYEIHQLLLNSSLSVGEKIHPPQLPLSVTWAGPSVGTEESWRLRRVRVSLRWGLEGTADPPKRHHTPVTLPKKVRLDP